MFQPGLNAKSRQLLHNSKLARRVDAEELTNMAFAKAWEKHSTLASQSTKQVAGFLLTTLRNCFVDMCRPMNLEQSSPTWFTPAAEDQSPSAMIISEEQERRLHATLAELPERYRKVLIMRHMHGMKYREIAESLETTTGAIAGAARDGLKLLTERIESE